MPKVGNVWPQSEDCRRGIGCVSPPSGSTYTSSVSSNDTSDKDVLGLVRMRSAFSFWKYYWPRRPEWIRSTYLLVGFLLFLLGSVLLICYALLMIAMCKVWNLFNMVPFIECWDTIVRDLSVPPARTHGTRWLQNVPAINQVIPEASSQCIGPTPYLQSWDIPP